MNQTRLDDGRLFDIYVLAACDPDSPYPIAPRVFTDKQTAAKAFDTEMRTEWSAIAPTDDEGCSIPYPEDPDKAHEILNERMSYNWGRYELTTFWVSPPKSTARQTLKRWLACLSR